MDLFFGKTAKAISRNRSTSNAVGSDAPPQPSAAGSTTGLVQRRMSTRLRSISVDRGIAAITASAAAAPAVSATNYSQNNSVTSINHTTAFAANARRLTRSQSVTDTRDHSSTRPAIRR